MTTSQAFDENVVIHKLKHYLPSQAPLKDFVHHNTLHAFQEQKFERGIRHASKSFGYKVSLSLSEYRTLFEKGKIKEEILERRIYERHQLSELLHWKHKVLNKIYSEEIPRKIGKIRALWKSKYHFDIDSVVHTNLFRILNSYLDQGISDVKFPIHNGSLISSIDYLEENTYVSLFKTKRARLLLKNFELGMKPLLEILVGNERYFEQYLIDQQFSHPGWSGLISEIELHPNSLLDTRSIQLKELVFLELVLEIDNLDHALGNSWQALGTIVDFDPIDILKDEEFTELDEVLTIWQEAYEWTYYDEVLAGVQQHDPPTSNPARPSFQAFFCIDDRECSVRRYIEKEDARAQTYSTPGHYGIDAFYQPLKGSFYTKICPVPVQPKYLIREVGIESHHKHQYSYIKPVQSFFKGWIITQTIGFWSAISLMFSILRPRLSNITSHSFEHMNRYSSLTVENRSPNHKIDHLQVGYNLKEMTDRVEAVLRSCGLQENFAPLVYIFGHGASSTNNTHYAAYDCGACSGRPGSVNSRSFCTMANHPEVREQLALRGLIIPKDTEFIGGLHDTTRDEFMFYDVGALSPENEKLHNLNVVKFERALKNNAKERSRRFATINTSKSAKKIHKKIKERSVSLFEPRPELNHATNTLCIIGRNGLNQNLFLDRRAFLNSYNYEIDRDGQFLIGIVNAAGPVCGGINLEYYFSRVDNEKLGAGSKLPHNVMGLIGVANGFEGDLRPGLPLQMIEAHNPLRLLMIIEHFPEVVLKVIQNNEHTYEWFKNEWVILAAINPETNEIEVFRDGRFFPYKTLTTEIPVIKDLSKLIESTDQDLPVFKLH
ncbi:MAG: DUF2309 domain-containing protein [Flavobacteriales bacterium]|nr:DUF2309 domain-containing protein [Flavobacteriales bacterium]